jgi:hypothetical protein
MKIPRLKIKVALILLLPIALLIKELLYFKPALTEALYSRLLYPPIGKLLSNLSGLLPISLAEILLYSFIAAMIVTFIKFIFNLWKSDNKLQSALHAILNALCTISIAYCLFLLLWGFNYYRQPLAYSLGYRIEKSTIADLKELSSTLIDKTNQLRAEVKENEAGIMYLDSGFKGAIKRADAGYQKLSTTYPIFKGTFGRAKGVILSRQLCYTGIAGIYFPYTGEANVNKLVPDFMLPSTINHEMAHQRGFAREDEANFIAYLTCKAHEDVDFQYSGYLLATIYSMNTLYQYDIESYKKLTAKYSEGVKRDLKYNTEFWKQFEGPVEELQERVNDTYLKSNKQTDGIYSYGRMVDLLLAEYKNK